MINLRESIEDLKANGREKVMASFEQHKLKDAWT
jgi:hypothetical protein